MSSDLPHRSTDGSAWRDRVYTELRGMARALMDGERTDHTLQPTDLVHETWLRLTRSRNAGELEQGEFLGLAAQAMRRILTEYARGRDRHKRGGGWRRTTLSSLVAEQVMDCDASGFAVDLDRVLTELESFDAELARIVELRFYAGCTTLQIAAAVGSSERTVKRRFRFARAWLYERITESDA